MDLLTQSIVDRTISAMDGLASADDAGRIEAINAIRLALHKLSPFSAEPVDCVLWVRGDDVHANDYNPNSVAPPEMRLLERSISEDGYTQPIVAWDTGSGLEVVDGFHRNRVGKECKAVRGRVNGYLPVTIVNGDRTDRSDRIAATIRHNRARGKHRVEAMSDIVIELKRRNWSDDRIAKELGMDQDEILRLCQITGLADLFSDQEFSKSWDVEGDITEDDFAELSDDATTYGEEAEEFRTVNTSDEGRVFHTFDKWECHKAGFYLSSKPGMTADECKAKYVELLTDTPAFQETMRCVVRDWPNSCEHYLTNRAMNRIAWLGQASVCYRHGVPSEFRSGYFLLTEKQRAEADAAALEVLNAWLEERSEGRITMEEAAPDRQSILY